MNKKLWASQWKNPPWKLECSKVPSYRLLELTLDTASRYWNWKPKSTIATRRSGILNKWCREDASSFKKSIKDYCIVRGNERVYAWTAQTWNPTSYVWNLISATSTQRSSAIRPLSTKSKAGSQCSGTISSECARRPKWRIVTTLNNRSAIWRRRS